MKTVFYSILLALITSATWGGFTSAQQDDNAKTIWTRKSGEDWSGFLGPNADGKSAETGILNDWTDERLKLVWKIDTGEGYGAGTFYLGTLLPL